MKIKKELIEIFQKALDKLEFKLINISISNRSGLKFGHYQFNEAMKLAKIEKQNPSIIAKKIIENIDKSNIIERVEVAGAGFINIWIKKDWIENKINFIKDDNRLGVIKNSNPKTIIIDYSSPNIAKEMHVGHLRSTIIGDSLNNLLDFLGHKIIRQNHIGDWGTQFGMLITYLQENNLILESINLLDLENSYKASKKRFDEDENFANLSRQNISKLQNGDRNLYDIWKNIINISMNHCEEVYSKLKVKLNKNDIRGESFYNNQLQNLINFIDKQGGITISNGAKCIFLDNSQIPVIVEKNSGGFLYSTTDLSALKFRNDELKADEVLYVVDSRQSEYFKKIFKIAKDFNLVKKNMILKHINFGTMMDKSGKPFKTRDGKTVKLIKLLDEAVDRAKKSIINISDENELNSSSLAIGIGAIKYADLSISRDSNYLFNWDRMLNFNGNTSLYIQYGYVRIQSILKKSNFNFKNNKFNFLITNQIEFDLAIHLLKFEDNLIYASKNYTPHTITTYLYDLVVILMKFYEENKILDEDIENRIKISRLIIIKLTGKIIKQGLEILGIETLNKI